MPLSLHLPPGRRKYLLGFILLLFIAVIGVAFSRGDSNPSDPSRREMLLRKIGHEILLQSGDSVSRVLPVKKVSENEYQVSFENEFSFQPDSLVNTTRRVLANEPDALDYMVNVLNCANSGVVYGYAVSKNKKDDIISCLGRKQPKACYLISIKFQAAKKNTATYGYLLGGLALLTWMGFIVFKPGKSENVLSEDQPGNFDHQTTSTNDHSKAPQDQSTYLFTLGSVLFDAQRRQLQANEKTIDLTGTETRVLRIFALSPNQTIERSRLQKEIWEDEGVIVGRSLDMFISKLRKKLEVDPAVKIVVVRGKGYRLEISS